MPRKEIFYSYLSLPNRQIQSYTFWIQVSLFYRNKTSLSALLAQHTTHFIQTCLSHLEKVIWLLITPLKTNSYFTDNWFCQYSLYWKCIFNSNAKHDIDSSRDLVYYGMNLRTSQSCLRAAFPQQHTARSTFSNLSHLLVLHRSPAFGVWVVGDVLQKSRSWLCSQLSD